MKTTHFLASTVKAAFALAAVFTLSFAIASCSKDDDNEPKVPANTIVLDGVTMPIIDAGIDEDELNEGNYDIVLFVSENKGIKIMAGEEAPHGKNINLTEKEPEHDDLDLSVGCYKPEPIFENRE